MPITFASFSRFSGLNQFPVKRKIKMSKSVLRLDCHHKELNISIVSWDIMQVTIYTVPVNGIQLKFYIAVEMLTICF